MRGAGNDNVEAELSFGWEDGPPGPDDPSIERIAAYAVVLARMLGAAGFTPHHLDIGLRRGAQGGLELHVRGEVPDIPEADFVSLAQVTLHTFRQQRGLADDTELRAELESASRPSQPALLPVPPPVILPSPTDPHAIHPAPIRGSLWSPPVARLNEMRQSLPMGRIVVGVVLGLLLGVVGLPRLELPSLTSPQAAPAALVVPTGRVAEFDGAARNDPAALQLTPASPAVVPTPTSIQRAVPTPTSIQRIVPTPTSIPRVLFAEAMLSPLASWPDDPGGNAWFDADNAYHLYAREPGRFVATGVPLSQSVTNGMLTAQFRKVGGPAGGGYGLIVRHQGAASELDGRNQAGRYLVLEIGDRGDVGIWERNQTRWIDVFSWSHSEAVRPGEEPNALFVTLRDGKVRFEVNGALVTDVTYDAMPSSGGVGIFAGGDLNEVALEWLRIETTDK